MRHRLLGLAIGAAISYTAIRALYEWRILPPRRYR